MLFKKDEYAWYYKTVAKLARELGDDPATVKQKVEAARAKVAAEQAYYDDIRTKARAAGDDLITAEWKVNIARAERSRESTKDFLLAQQRSNEKRYKLSREYALAAYSGKRLDHELLDIEVKHSKEQIGQDDLAGVDKDYKKSVRNARIEWFYHIFLVRFFAALVIGFPIAVLIFEVLRQSGFGSQLPPYVGLLVAMAVLALPVESYWTRGLEWAESIRLSQKLMIVAAPFIVAFFSIQQGKNELLYHAFAWLFLVLGSLVVSMEAKGLDDSGGWEGIKRNRVALPGAAIILALSVVIEMLATGAGRQYLLTHPQLTDGEGLLILTVVTGTPLLVLWWLWLKFSKPANKRGSFSVSGLVGGAADAAGRGKALVVGLWFAALGFFLLWIFGPWLIAGFGSWPNAPIVWLVPAVGAAIGAYLFLARGVAPIWSAISWSSISTDTHGKARTATESELRQAGLMPRRNAIYLGQFLDGVQEQDAMGYPGRVHLVTIGPPGSGKGTGLIIPNLSELRRSILIIDPKGEAAAITARKRAQFGRVVMLNPFNVLTKERPWLKSSGFNPLATLDKASSHFVDDATGIAEALVRIEGNDPHWSASAQDLIAALVMYEVISNGRGANLGNVRKMVTEPLAVKDGVPIGLVATLEKMNLSDYQPLKAKIGKFLTPTPEVRSIVSAAGTQTRFLDSPLIVDDLASTNAFSFADMKKEIVTVYLILPATHLESHSNWLRLMIVSALRELLATPPSSKLPPVLFMLDEFAQLGHLPAISNAMNIARGFGVQLWPFVQDLNQLHSIYKDNWQNFIGARGALTSFAPHDLFTARYLSDLCGNKTVIVESENERTGSAGMGRGRGPQGLPLFRPEELMAMPSGQMLCFVDPVKNPIMARAPGYWTTEFASGLDDNPYYQG